MDTLARVIKLINTLKIKMLSDVPVTRAVRVRKLDPFWAAIKEYTINF